MYEPYIYIYILSNDLLLTGDTGGAVDEDEDHATEGPGDAEKADTVAGSGLFLVTDDGGDGDVEEEEGGDELGDEGSVEGPQLDLRHVDEGCRRWVYIVFPVVPFLSRFLRHLSLSFLSLSLSVTELNCAQRSGWLWLGVCE